MKHFGALVLVFLFVVFSISPSRAQETKIAIDTNNILLGDQIKLKVSIELPPEASVVFPAWRDTLTKDIEIIQTSPVDTGRGKDNNLIYSQTLTVTAFDSGYFVVPPILFEYSLKNDTQTYRAETEPMLLEVRKVKINPEADIKDIKDIMGAPITFMEVFPFILGGLLVLVLIFFGIRLYNKFTKKNKPITFIKKPDVPPHTEALSALEELKRKKLWENQMVKEYYSELTEIARYYIERAFEVYAMEMTTDEIKSGLQCTKVPSPLQSDIIKVLALSDLVKFAKYVPIVPDHEMCFNTVLTFVKETTVLYTRPPKEENNGSHVFINDFSTEDKTKKEE